MAATTNVKLSEIALKILTAIHAGKQTVPDIALDLKVKTAVVTGSLTGLKRHKFVSALKSGVVKTTKTGENFLAGPKAPREGSKMAKAMEVLAKLPADMARKDKIATLVKKCGLSDAGASTYISMIAHRPEATPAA